MAHTLDLIGERWTMLIVRDLMMGPARFSDLRDQLDGIAPNLLAERLRFLSDAGLVGRTIPDGGPHRGAYQLTPRGRELSYVVQELARFGIEEWSEPERHPHYLTRGAVLSLMMPERLGADGWSARLELDRDTVDIVVAPQGPEPSDGERALGRTRLRLAPPESEEEPDAGTTPDVVVRADIETLVALRRGELTVAEARRQDRLAVRGDETVGAQVAALLGWDQASSPSSRRAR